jgi:hypothetical protein
MHNAFARLSKKKRGRDFFVQNDPHCQLCSTWTRSNNISKVEKFWIFPAENPSENWRKRQNLLQGAPRLILRYFGGEKRRPMAEWKHPIWDIALNCHKWQFCFTFYIWLVGNSHLGSKNLDLVVATTSCHDNNVQMIRPIGPGRNPRLLVTNRSDACNACPGSWPHGMIQHRWANSSASQP